MPYMFYLIAGPVIIGGAGFIVLMLLLLAGCFTLI